MPGFRSYPVVWSTFGFIYAGQQLAIWCSERKSLAARLLAQAAFELRELEFDLVAWHPAAVTLVQTQHHVHGVDGAGVVVVNASRSDGRGLPATIAALLVTAGHRRARPAATA